MLAGRQLAGVRRQKELRRAQIGAARQAFGNAMAALLTTLQWIEWGVRMLRFLRPARQRSERGNEKTPQ